MSILLTQLVLKLDAYKLILLFFLLGFQGRSKNVWESPKGCLMFSFTIQMENGRIVPFVQYVVSLAMTEAINDICQQNVSVFVLEVSPIRAGTLKKGNKPLIIVHVNFDD